MPPGKPRWAPAPHPHRLHRPARPCRSSPRLPRAPWQDAGRGLRGHARFPRHPIGACRRAKALPHRPYPPSLRQARRQTRAAAPRPSASTTPHRRRQSPLPRTARGISPARCRIKASCPLHPPTHPPRLLARPPHQRQGAQRPHRLVRSAPDRPRGAWRLPPRRGARACRLRAHARPRHRGSKRRTAADPRRMRCPWPWRCRCARP